MTTRTVAVFYRPVLAGILRNDGVDVVILTVCSDNGFIMAVKTEAERRGSQVVFKNRTMGVMAVVALSLLIHHRVFELNLVRFFRDVFVAVAAEVCRRLDQLILVVGGVRAVTPGTPLFHGRMLVFTFP
jgi:adenylylsulfate kinase-like enzyme